uniref:MCU domain-containing protein n=1 Tax=Macrostomum lignano TaxID=282301 RepID=A0A1I8FQ09_9PLAT
MRSTAGTMWRTSIAQLYTGAVRARLPRRPRGDSSAIRLAELRQAKSSRWKRPVSVTWLGCPFMGLQFLELFGPFEPGWEYSWDIDGGPVIYFVGYGTLMVALRYYVINRSRSTASPAVWDREYLKKIFTQTRRKQKFETLSSTTLLVRRADLAARDRGQAPEKIR